MYERKRDPSRKGLGDAGALQEKIGDRKLESLR
jgi:hypothetical protein